MGLKVYWTQAMNAFCDTILLYAVSTGLNFLLRSLIAQDTAKKIITPTMHAYWSLFEPPHNHSTLNVAPPECVFLVADTNNAWWRQYAIDAQITKKQLDDIGNLQKRYCHV